MTHKNNVNHLIEILKDDIKTLKAGFEEYGINFDEKNDMYIINFNLFVELTKKYCFRGKSKVVQIPTSIIPPDKESELVPVTIIPVPEERIQLFKDIILKNFDEKGIFSFNYIYSGRTEPYNREKVYYSFFYALCNEISWQPNKTKETVKDFLDQWN